MTEETLKAIAEKLYLSLRSFPDRCHLAGWTKDAKTGSVTRPVVHKCSRCEAIDLYEALIAKSNENVSQHAPAEAV